MKKLLFCFVFCILTFSAVRSSAINPSNADWKLQFLLNDETAPFFTDTVRHTFISAAMQKISGTCKYAATAKIEGYVPPTGNNTSLTWGVQGGVKTVTEILGIKFRDTDYGIRRIRKRDLGLSKIATDEEARYWYITGWGATHPSVGVYNALSGDTGWVEIYYSGIADWDSCRAFRACFENEVALYAFYLTKLRQGQTEIANFIHQIAMNEILDLKIILETRPMDATVRKEVVPR
jgi:hypothetical protein